MARYPTFEEYEKSGKYNDGLKRTNDLLKKNPKDAQLLILRLRFLSVLKQNFDLTINELFAIQPPIQDLDDLVDIGTALVDSQRDDFPPPTSTGPVAAKFWDTATKTATTLNVKLDILSLRFAQAISHKRPADAQQALIQLKALLPKNRTIYMAHAAVTYLLSTEKGDMQARLALMLARKAVKEGFEKEDSGLDCRVSGQIFAGCGEVEDLKGVEGTRFGESKQVYEALRRMRERELKKEGGEGENVGSEADLLQAQLDKRKEAFAKLIETDAEHSDVLTFAASAVQFFAETTKTLPKDDRKRIKADACFLSLSALIYLFSRQRHNNSSPGHLLVAVYLAETLLRQNENIHEARMILVYLYMHLNLGSLALQMFHSLRVKEIQNDTVGHALFTGISLTLPFPSRGETQPKQKKVEVVDPKKLATNALAVYERCERKMRETEAAVLSHGQTGMMFDLEELSASLRTSVTRRIIHLEQRRLARLVDSGVGEDASLLGPRVTANWLSTTDNRDFRATFDFGCEVERLLYRDRDGTVPGQEWVLRALVADAAWCLALGKEAPVNDLEALVKESEKLELDLGSLRIHEEGDRKAESTPAIDAKVLTGDIACSVLTMLMRLRGGTDASIHGISRAVNAVHDAISRIPSYIFSEDDDSMTSTLPAANLRGFYTYLDILRIVEKAASYTPGKGSAAPAEALSELKKLAQIKRSQLQTQARVQRDNVSASNVRAVMLQDSALAEAIAPLNGVRDLGAFCEAVALSAREGLDGVGKIK